MTVKEPALESDIRCVLQIQPCDPVMHRRLQNTSIWKNRTHSVLKRIVDGTVEYKIQLDYIFNSYSKTKVHKMKPLIRTLLRISRISDLLYGPCTGFGGVQ